MSIPNHIIDQINSQADLVSIIGKHTTLKKVGNEYKGCCPFHGEKTPSFYVNPQKNIYHCFGCGASGNAIGFLKDYENLTFIEAVKELSKQTGIEIPEEDNSKISYKKTATPRPKKTPSTAQSNKVSKVSTIPNPVTTTPVENLAPITTPTHIQTETHHVTGLFFNDDDTNIDSLDINSLDNEMSHQAANDFMLDLPNHEMPSSLQNADSSSQEQDGNLYDLLENIHQFYINCLHNNPMAKHYFESRGLSNQTIETFGLGYAPRGWQHLEEAFPNDIEGLRLLGLVRTSEKGRDFDLLRDRVIFVIRDNQGRVIGFAGRALDNDVKPKYINSSDSPVFHKNHVLYGYYESRQHRANDWLVVEGYMDVIALYQAGIYGAVASMGTAVNEQQISRLLNLNPVLTLSFDGDAAGQKAAWRTLEVSLPVLTDDKSLRFLTLPDNHDPDTYLAEHGKQAMQQQIANAAPLSQYVFSYLSLKHDLSIAEGKAKLMAQVRALTNQLPKGSSFKYLLNNDIYQRVNGRKMSNAVTRDVMLNFTSTLTLNLNIYLCLLYQPTLLNTECNPDPIKSIWQRSGIDKIKPSEKDGKRIHSLGFELPPLPSWQDFNDTNLIELVEAIKLVSASLTNKKDMDAHCIMGCVSNALNEILSTHWADFYQDLTNRQVDDVEPFLTELLVRQLDACLLAQQKQHTNILIKKITMDRRQALLKWTKTLNKN
ncbi:CHC2 zinc finger domain-containing protein [Psychrobacter sp. HD31]|uniref:DNA primase n=1 Tax=Psychrobacter sp. HD31 TaxID=3112003 RepID=UPI003DA22EC7